MDAVQRLVLGHDQLVHQLREPVDRHRHPQLLDLGRAERQLGPGAEALGVVGQEGLEDEGILSLFSFICCPYGYSMYKQG